MRKRTSTIQLATAICAVAVASLGVPATAAAQSPEDEVLKVRIVAALQSATDVPADSITVAVSDGVVTLTGSVVCQECGGRRTPNGFGTVQQSLGAIVRAVPGVESVKFKLEYEPRSG